MSVWPALVPDPSLSGREGALVSVSITVQPPYLEALLEALAGVDFPINPQIYHDAEMSFVYADGHEETKRTTLVNFPAYAGRLDDVRQALQDYGFDPASIHTNRMLDEIHSQRPGSRRRIRVGQG